MDGKRSCPIFSSSVIFFIVAATQALASFWRFFAAAFSIFACFAA